jgi:hypothetical protein
MIWKKIFNKSTNFEKFPTPYYRGTPSDFHRYFGGYCRNLVQKITRSYKAKVGLCENCGTNSKQLDAAHVHGKERKEIIDSILSSYTLDGVVQINLDLFEKDFIEKHQPIEETIKILCKSCHNEYDNPSLINTEKPIINRGRRDTNRVHYQSSRLEFISNNIEPLEWNESFSIYVKSSGETFTMTKRDFYNVFSNVVNSESYLKKGRYSYYKVPKKAYTFLSS